MQRKTRTHKLLATWRKSLNRKLCTSHVYILPSPVAEYITLSRYSCLSSANFAMPLDTNFSMLRGPIPGTVSRSGKGSCACRATLAPIDRLLRSRILPTIQINFQLKVNCGMPRSNAKMPTIMLKYNQVLHSNTSNTSECLHHNHDLTSAKTTKQVELVQHFKS
jgi:hypothetical protein